MNSSGIPFRHTLLYLVAALAWLASCWLYSAPQRPDSLLLFVPFTLFTALYLYLFLRHGRLLSRARHRRILAEKRQLQLALEAADENLWDWELAGNSTRIFFSPTYCSMMGYTSEEFPDDQAGWHMLLHPDERSRVLDRIVQLQTSDESRYENTYRMRHKDGSYRWIHSRGRLFYNRQKQPVRFIGVAADITASIESAERLRLANLVFNSTHEGVLITDQDNRISFVNPAFTKITGYAPGEVLGRNPRMLQSGRHDRFFYTNLWSTLTSTGQWSGEIWNRRKNGEVLPQLQTISELRDENGVVSHRVAVFSDISLLKSSQNELSFLAHYDPLTGLPNRILLHEHLKLSLQRTLKHKTESALFLVDLDHFKTINEGLGHAPGDDLIKSIAQRLKNSMEQAATISRYGGDEFAIIAESLEGSSNTSAASIAQKILGLFNTPFVIGNQELSITASIGICLYPVSGRTAEEVFRNADTALSKAKDAGRATFAFYTSSLTEIAHQKLRVANQLRQALDKQQLVVYYQPVYSLHSQSILGCEALVRWQHPEQGMIPPMDFIQVAEDTGLILQVDTWVMEQACRQLQAWQKEGLPIDFVSVNVSSRLFHRDDLVLGAVRNALQLSGLDAGCLELEITESAMMEDQGKSIAIMHQLRDLGVRLAIDDFGTGYSSLGRLKYLPVDKFKIDQTFVRNLPHDSSDIAIIRAIIALGESMRLAVQAEGVETLEQADFLLEHKCVLSQGYLFGKPMPADELRALLLSAPEQA